MRTRELGRRLCPGARHAHYFLPEIRYPSSDGTAWPLRWPAPAATLCLVGHDVHFIKRLERLPEHQVEFALALYRDHELVRALLGGLAILLLPETSRRELEEISPG